MPSKELPSPEFTDNSPAGKIQQLFATIWRASQAGERPINSNDGQPPPSQNRADRLRHFPFLPCQQIPRQHSKPFARSIDPDNLDKGFAARSGEFVALY